MVDLLHAAIVTIVGVVVIQVHVIHAYQGISRRKFHIQLLLIDLWNRQHVAVGTGAILLDCLQCR
jgi:hypothetical protein